MNPGRTCGVLTAQRAGAATGVASGWICSILRRRWRSHRESSSSCALRSLLRRTPARSGSPPTPAWRQHLAPPTRGQWSRMPNSAAAARGRRATRAVGAFSADWLPDPLGRGHRSAPLAPRPVGARARLRDDSPAGRTGSRGCGAGLEQPAKASPITIIVAMSSPPVGAVNTPRRTPTSRDVPRNTVAFMALAPAAGAGVDTTRSITTCACCDFSDMLGQERFGAWAPQGRRADTARSHARNTSRAAAIFASGAHTSKAPVRLGRRHDRAVADPAESEHRRAQRPAGRGCPDAGACNIGGGRASRPSARDETDGEVRRGRRDECTLRRRQSPQPAESTPSISVSAGNTWTGEALTLSAGGTMRALAAWRPGAARA